MDQTTDLPGAQEAEEPDKIVQRSLFLELPTELRLKIYPESLNMSIPVRP